MFEKFGEFDSYGEINELAENLLNEGDTESLKVMAKENGIQRDFVDMYLQGEIPVLCDQLTAALGKIDVEAAELKPKEIMEDWVEYLRGQCMENELLAFSSTPDVVVQESADRGQGYHQGSRCICRKGHAWNSGHGQSKADHHGLLHGKVGGTDEKESYRENPVFRVKENQQKERCQIYWRHGGQDYWT